MVWIRFFCIIGLYMEETYCSTNKRSIQSSLILNLKCTEAMLTGISSHLLHMFLSSSKFNGSMAQKDVNIMSMRMIKTAG